MPLRRRSLRVRSSALVLLVGTLALGGCVTDLSGPVSTPAPLNESEAIQPDDSLSDAQVPETPALAEECPATVQAAIHEVVTAQSSALRDGDFARAYGFASSSFRDAVTQEQFERVITRQYDMLLYFDAAQFGRCDLVAADLATINVEIRSTVYPPVAMRYDMVRDDSWRVSAVDLPVSSTPNT